MRFASYATIALSFVGAAIALPAVKRVSEGDLEAALNNLAVQISVSETILVGDPSGDLLNPSDLYNRLVDGGSLADAATADAKALPTLSEADGQVILVKMQNAVPHLENFLQMLADDKNKFVVESLILGGLQTFKTSLTTLGNSLVAIAPPNLEGDAAMLFREVTSDLAKAIKVYSS
ncbi:hypothetical protein BDN72DRAFT_862582 [Pluteus cervinus]|uniref:Uncharacterized protein n=1 Tax=Pluteus cervinus TaxID=181527 RepID=A0ACD3AAB8_9AGAR|nr:hypothetical protein BDN72DRAFT_862582 [Pluteus cervinus]